MSIEINSNQIALFMVPFVILLDIDGTIVGNVSPIVSEWELIQDTDKRKLKDFKKVVINKLHNGLMRGHLSDFCAMVNRHLECVEFFIYTASDPTWALFLVSCLEEATGIHFLRPIFTRKHCLNFDGDLKKSIDRISPQIFKKIKPKYKDLRKLSQKQKNKICLVDNNDVLSKNEKNKMIRCPSYDFTDVYDVFSRLDIETFSNSDCTKLSTQLLKYGLFPSGIVSRNTPMSFSAFRYYYYSRLCENIKKCAKQQDPQKDNFWIALANAICSEEIEYFDSNTMRRIDYRMRNELKT